MDKDKTWGDLECNGNTGRCEFKPCKAICMNNSNYDASKIGKDILAHVTKEPKAKYSPSILKRNSLRKRLSLTSDLQEQVDILKDSYKGDTAYILNCGPSLSDYSEEFLKEYLADKLTISVKQAYSAFPEVTDFHFFNCANLPFCSRS